MSRYVMRGPSIFWLTVKLYRELSPSLISSFRSNCPDPLSINLGAEREPVLAGRDPDLPVVPKRLPVFIPSRRPDRSHVVERDPILKRPEWTRPPPDAIDPLRVAIPHAGHYHLWH
jgi:hypothetical protein